MKLHTMKTLSAILLSALFTIALVDVIVAQPALPAFDNTNQAPLGGLGVLALAGGAYGLKKLRERKSE